MRIAHSLLILVRETLETRDKILQAYDLSSKTRADRAFLEGCIHLELTREPKWRPPILPS